VGNGLPKKMNFHVMREIKLLADRRNNALKMMEMRGSMMTEVESKRYYQYELDFRLALIIVQLPCNSTLTAAKHTYEVCAKIRDMNGLKMMVEDLIVKPAKKKLSSRGLIDEKAQVDREIAIQRRKERKLRNAVAHNFVSNGWGKYTSKMTGLPPERKVAESMEAMKTMVLPMPDTDVSMEELFRQNDVNIAERQGEEGGEEELEQIVITPEMLMKGLKEINVNNQGGSDKVKPNAMLRLLESASSDWQQKIIDDFKEGECWYINTVLLSGADMGPDAREVLMYINGGKAIILTEGKEGQKKRIINNQTWERKRSHNS